MSIIGNPVTIAKIPVKPFYLINPHELDALRLSIGGTDPIYIGGYSGEGYTPTMIVNYQSSGVDRFSIRQFTIDGVTKDYMYQGASWLGTMACPTKIHRGMYKTLYVSFIMTSNYTYRDCLHISLGGSLEWKTNNAFYGDILRCYPFGDGQRPPLNTLLEYEFDISNVNEDFYFGFYRYNVPFYIRELSLRP